MLAYLGRGSWKWTRSWSLGIQLELWVQINLDSKPGESRYLEPDSFFSYTIDRESL